ncbi:heavy metal sensor histidine kinase [Utexia brackfieldae]|uniref:heavy metal sensor histidine kinase n=1 Tax=Utexia brackfieldae TaxID=3074108 RepID=UPI00370D13BD
MKTNVKYTLFSSFRLAILVCSVTSILLFILSYFIERSFERYAINQSISELNAVISSLESELTVRQPSSPKELNKIEQNMSLILSSHYRLFVYIEDQHGNVILNTPGPNLAIIQQTSQFNFLASTRKTAIWDENRRFYRIAIANFNSPNGNQYSIITAVGQEQQLQYIYRLREGLTTLIMITGMISFIWTLIAIYLTQRPISRLIKRIESVTSKHLSYRIPLDVVPVKFIGIIQAFNDMLARIEDVFQRQRNFTADIAHEIRTPITNLATQTQIALSNARTTDEYREILYSNLEEYEKLSKMISDMLFLAQADNKLLTPELVEIDLLDTFHFIFDYFEPLIEDKNIAFKLAGEVPPIEGDRLMLNRAISNLISNAIRYTPSEQTIHVTLKEVDKKWVQFTISNPGKKIEPKHLPKLFDRFYRVDKSRQRNGEGAGIGLAIVKSIIETLKGQIHAESDDISTRFIVTLPIKKRERLSLSKT